MDPEKDITIPIELQICEPLLNFYIRGILLPMFKNLSKYFACAKPDFVEQARPPDDEERVIVG